MKPRNGYKFLGVMILLILCASVFGDYKMERSVFAPGAVGKAGGSVKMSEGAVVQTAATTVASGGNWVEQGYIHRPYLLTIDYAVVDSTPRPVFDPHLSQQGWYEPTGILELHADPMITDGNTRYYFYRWSSPTAVFADASANETTMPFYKSHIVTAEYKTQYQIIFASNTKNDEEGTYIWDPVLYTNMKLLNATDYVDVSYFSQGVPLETDEIYDDGGGVTRTVWADRGTNWTFTTTNKNYDPITHATRWLTEDSDRTGTVGINDAGRTITCDYYQQFKCAVNIIYSYPTPPYDPPGDVNIVNWKTCGHNGSILDGYDDTDDWSTATGAPQWADAGSRLEFPEQTTGEWFTVNYRNWYPLDKPLNVSVTYGQPIPAVLTANALIWRGYNLMGVPVYPTEDTSSTGPYRTRAAAVGFTPPSWPPASRGDQDVVLFDDFFAVCGVDDGGWPGKYSEWWFLNKNSTTSGAYNYYRGPGRTSNPEPFWPGIGYWLVQDHCTQIAIDVIGTMVDTLEPYAIGLGRNTGPAYSQYNMIANPFYNPNELVTIPVKWSNALVYLTSNPEDKRSVVDAAIAGWIDATAQAYRGGVYVPMNAAVGDPDELNEWEGFWVKTGLNSIGDSVVISMRPNSLASRFRERPAPVEDLASQWTVRIGAVCPELGQGDLYNRLGYKEYQPTCEQRILDEYEPPEFLYPMPHLRVYALNESDNEKAMLYRTTRAAVMTWSVVLDCRGTKDHKVTVNWDLMGVPSGFRVNLKDADHDVYVDMITEKEYSFKSDGRTHKVEVIAVAPVAWVAKEMGEIAQVPAEFYLASPSPNPFNASCRIEFGLAEGDGGHIILEVFDLLGRKIKTLADCELEPGTYVFTWEGLDEAGRNLPSGTYFTRFDGAGRQITKKISLVR